MAGSGEILDLDIEHWIEPKACLAQSPAGRFDIGAGCGKNRRTGLGFLKRLRESQDRGKGSGADRRWNRWCWGPAMGRLSTCAAAGVADMATSAARSAERREGKELVQYV